MCVCVHACVCGGGGGGGGAVKSGITRTVTKDFTISPTSSNLMLVVLWDQI